MSHSVGIVGAGHIGGSIAQSLRRFGTADVLLFDVDGDHLAQAAEMGFKVQNDLSHLVNAADVIVLATPAEAYRSVLSTIRSLVRESDWQPLVMDVGSVQGVIHATAAEILEESSIRWIGTHPMAGTEKSGFLAGRPDLFVGATWAITPHDGSDDRDLFGAMEVVRACGANAMVLTVKHHDQAAAKISHMPHVLSALVANSVRNESDGVAMSLAAGSFRDLTRVAGSSPEFVSRLCALNADELEPLIDAAIKDLKWVQEHLTDGADLLTGYFATARDNRRALMSRESSFGTVTVPRRGSRALVDALLEICSTGSRIESCELKNGEFMVRFISSS